MLLVGLYLIIVAYNKEVENMFGIGGTAREYFVCSDVERRWGDREGQALRFIWWWIEIKEKNGSARDGFAGEVGVRAKKCSKGAAS